MTASSQCRSCMADVVGSPNFCPSCGGSLQEAGPTGEAKLSGLHVGGFVLGEPIRTGAVGEIYLAKHESLGKQVVIKLIHPQLLGDPNTSRRFRREALAASRLNHPNVIHVLDFGQLESGRLYLAMEYIEGIDLAELQHRDGPLPPLRIVSLMRQICFALDEAHRHGVLHRDLKPENIMVGDRPNMRDHVKVVDFGIAKVTDASQSLASVQSIGGLFCGTPEYMSPEQSRGGEIDGRSDLYSLGVILYQLLVGHVPFQDATPLGVITRHLSETPVPPEEIVPDVQQELAALSLRLLSKEREQRVASAMELASEFDYIESQLKGASSPHSTTEREAATLSDIPVCDTTQETRPQPVQAPLDSSTQPVSDTTQETRPQLAQIPSDSVTQPALVDDDEEAPGDTDRELPIADLVSDGGADKPDIETSPGDDLAAATQDVPVSSYPRTTPMHPVGLGQRELARTGFTGLLLALAIFMVGWLVFNVWPASSTADGQTQESVRETPPAGADDR